MSLEQLARDPDAMGEARSLFANGCAGCHGSDARGAPGFPNLTDNDWLYGNAPETLRGHHRRRTHGRDARLAGGADGRRRGRGRGLRAEPERHRRQIPALVQAGAARYAMFCVACHGADARGNPVLGAPNLADTIWLYGGDAESLRTSIAVGRQNQMPAHEALLGPDRVRLMAAYVLSLGGRRGGNGNGSAGGG